MEKGIISEAQQIKNIRYKLFDVFDASGNPVYKSGNIEDVQALKEIKDSLLDAREAARAYSVTAMGELVITIKGSPSLTLALIYDISAGKYRSMVYKTNILYLTAERFAALLDGLRK